MFIESFVPSQNGELQPAEAGDGVKPGVGWSVAVAEPQESITKTYQARGVGDSRDALMLSPAPRAQL
jgi:hypothetical protein